MSNTRLWWRANRRLGDLQSGYFQEENRNFWPGANELSPGRLPALITTATATTAAAQGTKGALARPRTLQPRPARPPGLVRTPLLSRPSPKESPLPAMLFPLAKSLPPARYLLCRQRAVATQSASSPSGMPRVLLPHHGGLMNGQRAVPAPHGPPGGGWADCSSSAPCSAPA